MEVHSSVENRLQLKTWENTALDPKLALLRCNSRPNWALFDLPGAVCLASSWEMVVVVVLDLVGLNMVDLVTMGLPFVVNGFGLTIISFSALVVLVERGTRPKVLCTVSRCSGEPCRVADLVTGFDLSASTLSRMTNTCL